MSNSPKDRLTVKESWVSGNILNELNKAQKETYRNMSVADKREIIYKYQNNIPFEIKEAPPKQENEFKSIERTLNKRGLSSISTHTKELLEKNRVGQFIDSFTSRLVSTAADPRNSSQIFIYELINQNFALIKLLDDNFRQNNTLIRQNEEIIELLKEIAKK